MSSGSLSFFPASFAVALPLAVVSGGCGAAPEPAARGPSAGAAAPGPSVGAAGPGPSVGAAGPGPSVGAAGPRALESPDEPSAAAAESTPKPSVSALPSEEASPEEPATESCASAVCRRFGSPQAAFRWILKKDPRILAIGEAHAPKGATVDSVTTRFSRDLLPLAKGQASALVVELLLPDPRCRKAATEVRKEQEVVTEHQAETSQNEFVALGHRARALGLTPYPLRPTCEDLGRIASAGSDAVMEMLDAITRLTKASVRRLLASPETAMVIAYGGAMHNDLEPRENLDKWSFGPELSQDVGGRYIELDLIVPEFIKDNASWRSLPWYSAYDRDRFGDSTMLIETSPRAFVLVFPAGG